MSWQLQIGVMKFTLKTGLHNDQRHRRHIGVKAGGPGYPFRYIYSNIKLK